MKEKIHYLKDDEEVIISGKLLREHKRLVIKDFLDFHEFPDSNISGRMTVNPYWLEHLLNLFFQGYLGEVWEEIMDTEMNHCGIDPCLKPLLKWLKSCDYDVVASCCGHSVYPMTIIVKGRRNGVAYYTELLSGISIPRQRKFYKKDKDGFYYIPELNTTRKFFSSQP